MRWIKLFEAAARQDGVVTLALAAWAGIPARTLRARAAQEGWARLHPGVWVLPGRPIDHRVKLRCAILSIGAPVLIARRSVLAQHGVIPPPPRPELVVRRERGLHPRPGIQLIATRHGDLLQSERRGEGVSPSMALVQLAAAVPPEQLRRIAIDARQQQVLELSDVRRIALGTPTLDGRAALLRVLADLGEDGSDSPFESLVRHGALARGMHPSAGPTLLHTPDGPINLDITFPGKVGVECDGFAFHNGPDDLSIDALRHNAITMTGGWAVLRLTWRMWAERAGRFLDQVDTLSRERASG